MDEKFFEHLHRFLIFFSFIITIFFNVILFPFIWSDILYTFSVSTYSFSFNQFHSPKWFVNILVHTVCRSTNDFFQMLFSFKAVCQKHKNHHFFGSKIIYRSAKRTKKAINHFSLWIWWMLWMADGKINIFCFFVLL